MGIGNGIGIRWGRVSLGGGAAPNLAFEFTVKTDNAGTSAANQFTIPITSATPYDIETSDGQTITGATGATTLTFPSAGTYTVSITDSCEGWRFNGGGDRQKLLDISNWGVFKNNVASAFRGCLNMTCSAVDAPIHPPTTMDVTFYQCRNFNGAIGNWDVSNVTSFNSTFHTASVFNQPLNSWDVSNATNFQSTFKEAVLFNQPLDNWVTTNATNMSQMFNMRYQPKGQFDQDITGWDVSNVTNFSYMFTNTLFNQDISVWDMSSMNNITSMFAQANLFNQDISSWPINQVTSLDSVFNGASSFNQDITGWDTSNVTSFAGLFASASSMTFDISVWDVTSLTNLQSTFSNADLMNLDLSSWDTSNVTRMDACFANIPWDPNISSWDTSSVTNMKGMFSNNTANITSDYSSWDTSNVVTLESFGQGSNFNGNISAWDTSSVTNLRSFMYGNTTFSGDLSAWDTSSVTTMIYNPFYQTSSFDSDLGGWDVSNVTVIGGIFKSGIPFSTANYDSLLVGWEASLQAAYPGGVGYPHTIGVSFPGSQYSLGSAAETARTSLINTYGWTITDGGAIDNRFAFTVDTTLGDALPQFTIPTNGTGYNYNIETSDGQVITGNTGNTTITFPSSGTYDVKISGDFPMIYFNNVGDKSKLTDISKWGSNPWTSMVRAFRGCNNLNVSATDAPNLSGVTDTSYMFAGCSVFNSNINHWDVSTITNIRDIFNGSAFNQPLDNWDVSNVTSMVNMFAYTPFNQPIGVWDVGSVTNFGYMFRQNFAFDQPLNSWNMSGKTNLTAMFYEARAFNQDLDLWDVSACTSMYYMFQNATLFNGNITTWNTSNVTNMSGMFNMWWGGARPFNQNLNSWDVSNVTDMGAMFAYCINYNQPMNTWNTSNVTNMGGMFTTTYDFNQDITTWDVSNVTNMSGMLEKTHAFNRDISGWDVSSVTSFHRFMNMQGTAKGSFNFDISGWNTSSAVDFTSAFWNTSMNSNLANWDIDQVTVFTNFKSAGDPLSLSDYDATLVSWEAQLQAAFPGGVGYTPAISINFNSSQYTLGSAAETARTSLINTYGWTITDGGGVVDTSSYIFTAYNSNPGATALQVTLQANTVDYTYDYNVETSDGQVFSNQTGSLTINFSTAGPYDIKVSGTYPSLRSTPWVADVKQFGTNQWQDFAEMYSYNHQITSFSATDTPDLSNCTSLYKCFTQSPNYNDPKLNNWDVSNIEVIEQMFFPSSSFNQPLDSWDTSSLTNMYYAFNGSPFNKSLAAWDVSSLTNAFRFLGAALSVSDYDATLISWAAQSVQNNVSVGFANSQYTLGGAAEAARNTLINTYGWTITDGGGIAPPFLLDTYTGATAAYSLRDLSSSTTNVVRVRRSSDNTEQDFTSTQVTDGTLEAFVGAGNDGFVRTWYEQSGQNANLMFIATEQPQIVTNGVLNLDNGTPYMLSTGNHNGYQYVTPVPSSTSGTLFCTYNTNDNGNGCIFARSGSVYAGILQSGANTSPDSNVGTPSYYKNGTLIPSATRDDIFTNFKTNKDELCSITNLNMSNNGNIPIYAYNYSSSDYTQIVKMKEWILFDADQSANQSAIETNINDYYTIY